MRSPAKILLRRSSDAKTVGAARKVTEQALAFDEHYAVCLQITWLPVICYQVEYSYAIQNPLLSTLSLRFEVGRSISSRHSSSPIYHFNACALHSHIFSLISYKDYPVSMEAKP